jgi:hypothetical protein
VCKLLHVMPVATASGLNRRRDSLRHTRSGGPKIRTVAPQTRVKLQANTAFDLLRGPRLKSTNSFKIALGVLALPVAWVGFQLATHGHTGILRALVEVRHFLSEASASSGAQQRNASGPPGPQHSVNLSWKASTSPVVGYNVYRRGTSGMVKLNSEPVTATTYVDSTVQPGQTYFYATRAVNAKGTESTPSNEVRADIPPR